MNPSISFLYLRGMLPALLALAGYESADYDTATSGYDASTGIAFVVLVGGKPRVIARFEQVEPPDEPEEP